MKGNPAQKGRSPASGKGTVSKGAQALAADPRPEAWIISVEIRARLFQVGKVEFFHQPPGRERVRVTVEYVSGEVKVFEVH